MKIVDPGHYYQLEYLDGKPIALPCSWRIFCKATLSNGSGTVLFMHAYSTAALMDVRTVEDEKVIVADPLSLPRHVYPNVRWLIPLALDKEAAPCELTFLQLEANYA